MRERIPHDRLAFLGGTAIVGGLLLPIYWLVGAVVLILWVTATAACWWKYR
jgi:hypothetical protein